MAEWLGYRKIARMKTAAANPGTCASRQGRNDKEPFPRIRLLSSDGALATLCVDWRPPTANRERGSPHAEWLGRVIPEVARDRV
jgi:hypothetical protein